jgi:hypothetical protein
MKESRKEEEEEREFLFNGRDSSILPSDFDLFELLKEYEEDDI